MSFAFVVNSVILGVGLAMDAFSVSLANGLNEPCMKKKKMVAIAFVFAFFQAAMPITGWFFVHFLADKFNAFRPLIPWIALVLLAYIGIEMIHDGLKSDKKEMCKSEENLNLKTLIIQGVATSIDALSVGFTTADYNFHMAFLSALIISAVTYLICIFGVVIGKYFGTKIAGKSSVFGGIILIGIGIKIFITGIY